MTTEEINNSLYRPIKSGVEFDGFFPNSSCVSVSLGKGNTKIVIKEMAKWAKQYASQSKHIATELHDDSLEETCYNIHQFLFWHLQYAIDEYEQDLKAPACAWETRHEGTDCKTFTIFVSTILLNLGIKHYLRRVKFPGKDADAFTHVYVVVPENQKIAKLTDGYYVIDATIKEFEELPFLKKDDIYMEPRLPINGLAAPMQLACATNCGCKDHLVIDDVQFLASPITKEVEDNFSAMLNLLATLGVNQSKLNQIHKTVNFFIDEGVDPYIDVSEYGITINSEYIPFFDDSAKRLSVYSNNGLALPWITAITAVTGTGGTETQGNTNLGVFSSLIQGLNLGNFIGEIGQIFQNGFMLSCFNSTFTPSKAALQCQNELNTWFQEALKALDNSQTDMQVQNALNEIMRRGFLLGRIYIDVKENNNWNNCSMKALKEVYIPYGEQVQQIAETTRDYLMADYNVVFDKNIQIKSLLEIKEYNIKEWGDNDFINYPTYKVTKKQTAIVDGGGNSGNGGPNKPDQAGSNIGMVLLAAAAIGGIVYGTKKLK